MVAGVGLEGNKTTRAGPSSEDVMGVTTVTKGMNVLTHQHLNRHSSVFSADFLVLPNRPSFFVRVWPSFFFFFTLFSRPLFCPSRVVPCSMHLRGDRLDTAGGLVGAIRFVLRATDDVAWSLVGAICVVLPRK
ncbi:unnamed protein product [Ectocarpus sp. 13 AM-2016]